MTEVNKEKGMNVLSLFDGISCGRTALNKQGIKVNSYYASEVDGNAMKVTQSHYPNTIQLGDVRNIHYKNEKLYTDNGIFNCGKIDLLIGGSPCQNFSFAGNKKGMSTKENIEIITLENYLKLKEDGFVFEGQSYLFWEYVRLLKEIKPKHFLLENVKMSNKWKDVITGVLKFTPILINSSLVSYQKRNRLYWTSINNGIILQPQDKNINFQDYKDTDFDYCLKYKLNKTPSRERMWNNGVKTKGVYSCKNITDENKIECITRKQDRCPNSGLIKFDGFARFLTTRELELGQTLPIGYTELLTKNQSESVLGNCWTVDVITHIFNFLPEEYKFNNKGSDACES